MSSLTAIAAHRGASGLVPFENTIAAIARAAEVGAAWVELDVRRLGDDALVLMHDPSFDGHPLADLDLEGLRARAGRKGLRVPTLTDALRACRSLGVRVDIELKELGTEAAVVAEARAILPSKNYFYTSFCDETVHRLAQLDPDASRGLLLGRPEMRLGGRVSELYPVERLRACRADLAAPHWSLLSLGLLPRLRREGLPVWVWTVNTASRLRWLLSLGVDGIITDHPDRAVALRGQVQARAEPGELSAPDPWARSA